MEQSSTTPVPVCPAEARTCSPPTLTSSSSCAIPGPCWKPVLPRVLGVGRIRGTQGGPFRPHLGGGPQRHGSRLSRKRWMPRSLLHCFGSSSEGTCESTEMLRSRVDSAQLQRTKALSTERQVPHCRITDDERCADLSEMLRTLVWVILECEWSHNSPWTARESRGPLVYLLVAPRGTAAHVHHGCGHPLGALASASPHFFFVEPLCCPHHCQFVFVPLVVRRAVVSLGACWTGPC